MKILPIPAKNSNCFPTHNYKPGDALPPRHIKVNALETLRRNAEAYEIYLRDEAARMERAGRRAA
jgi:hypothetical protein